jgi:hypothetical protein
MTDRKIAAYAAGQQLRAGILIGCWDAAGPAAARARLDRGVDAIRS